MSDPVVDRSLGRAEAAGSYLKAEILAGKIDFISIAVNRMAGIGVYH